jgi:hypothetical protein
MDRAKNGRDTRRLLSVIVLPEPTRFAVEPGCPHRAVRPERDAHDFGAEQRLLYVVLQCEVAPPQYGDHIGLLQSAELAGLVPEVVQNHGRLVDDAPSGGPLTTVGKLLSPRASRARATG